MRARLTVLVAVVLLVSGVAVGVRLLHGSAGARPYDALPTVVGGSSGSSSPPSSPTVTPTPSASPAPVTLPDGFVARPLRPGQRPPQFVVVSFDGAAWHEMWQHWFDVADRVPFRFTGFLSGVYLLSYDTRDHYHPPGYPAGTSAIGWMSPADVPIEIRDLNRALAEGDEIGTHFNGHFCVGAGLPTGGSTWNTADWDTELDQFFSLVANVDRNNGLTVPRLHLPAADVHGERTPCLEGSRRALFPSLRSHGLEYDASFSRNGLAWPTRLGGIWQLGMPVFPVHGALPDGRTGMPITAMDYNYYFSQRGATSAGLTPAQSARDGLQVLATYRDMYHAAYTGNRAPLILGNHFNDWNRGTYVDALTTFVEQTCGRPHTQCVPFSDLVAWLDVQRPSVLRHLQGLPAVTRP
ncbi:polysaccharide deacetylase [Nocardioides cynanchi]|uniref:polysaccharide deacetylase n=1 Tax=Nocardioides cynanchi TaxID=2558918 RepID=UPI0012461C54|nr:polysaccharide deacetylase [Nocardioides cynanchi]